MSPTSLPALPTPQRARWQPLRIGLVELFHYDSEEFWFRDGHLLLRGNNGTGKSKVLSLSLPFLLDAQLKSSRIEPDGDAGKKMAWNLLMGRHDRRMGYTWIEFGRVGEDGAPHYLTLGCGLFAAAARAQVDSWFFLLEEARIGEALWLTGPTRVVLTRERLREALEPLHGQVFDTAARYRHAVDERLFRLGGARYAALMDTLIQLRQPQLSKKPDEGSLSQALSEALPPMPLELLGDVADALNQLEEYRRELEEYEALERAVGQFGARYQAYAQTQARRQAGVLRRAQTGFDNASRELNDGRTALQAAVSAEVAARDALASAEGTLVADRERLDVLLSDPANRSARELEQADRDARSRAIEAERAQRQRDDAGQRLVREQQAGRAREQRADQAVRALADARREVHGGAAQARLGPDFVGDGLLVHAPSALAAGQAQALDAARNDLRHSVATRREQVQQLLRGCDALDAALHALSRAQEGRDERQDDAEEAAAGRAEADADVERASQAALDAWQTHLAGLHQLHGVDESTVLEALGAWVATLDGDNPARAGLQRAQQQAAERLAQQHAALTRQRSTLDGEQAALQSEGTRLERGEDTAPEPPHWRAPDARAGGRAGAPLWQVVDFQSHVDAAQRAGLEAALQAAGLLDAWVTPEGHLHAGAGTAALRDSHWVERPRQAWSLAGWLMPAAAPVEGIAPVPAAVLQRLLEAVACGLHDDGSAEAWASPDGRFRLGTLAGAWHKDAATHIGYAAREAARTQRLREIGARLAALAQEQAGLDAAFARHARDQHQAAEEWRSAPGDDALRAAHVEATARARTFQAARERLDQAEQNLRIAMQQRDAAHAALQRDAEDLRLPATRAALLDVAGALQQLSEQLQLLFQAVRELRDAFAEQAQQRQRTHEAEAEAADRAEQAAEARVLADEAQVRHRTLLESVGAAVEQLQQRLREAREAVRAGEASQKRCNDHLREAGEHRARADQRTLDAETVLADRATTRQQAITRLQGFATTGLLASALPDADIPPFDPAWTLESALTLARRAEQSLTQVKDDDDAWNRVQSQISQDYTELGRALSALGHQAQAETSDYGLVVGIVYRNRPERPDRLGRLLADEIAQRRELLTAREREVLENHLQAEIAAAVQKLLRDAERQVLRINEELAKRPTSTGVRFRLQWQTLAEGADGGAPVGLEAARKRLLHVSTDLWTAEDRRVVGELLQQRIAAERSRADAEGGGSLLEQLARALDYRRWHRFRVQRWQDGQWRPLSGPASSGERALGLTVPLFAAVSSYYANDAWPHAPRLVLLDEAFAGIDDAARAHCMGLVREFDLDFVITSEREWACYAALPGVAIAQLQRREGIDAVHVSRWSWDGRARLPEADPDRRFQPMEVDAADAVME